MMRQTMVLYKFVVGIFSVFAMIALAQSANAGQSEADSKAWLQKIHDAALTVNYVGTFVFQQANQMRASRITHHFDGKSEHEKFEILDGKPREYIRTNEEIVSYIPEIKLVFFEKRATQDVFPALVPKDSSSLLKYYRLHKAETGRIAGFESQALVLEPKDNLRYGYKFWVDNSTKLLLRAQTLNERNEVIEQISFTQLTIGSIDLSLIQPTFKNIKDWRSERAAVDTTTITGWHVKSIPPGFNKVREMRRMISSATTADGNPMKRPMQREVSQIVYSDGLAAISLFIEPATQGRIEGTSHQGALNVVGKRQGDFWLTIIGEVPTIAIKQVAGSIEFTSK